MRPHSFPFRWLTSSAKLRQLPGLLVLLLLGLLFVLPGAAQDRFSGQERVTAVDILVELQGPEGATKKGPDDLTAEDFTVLVDGRPVPVVAVERPGKRARVEGAEEAGEADSTGAAAEGETAERWTSLVYIDRALVGDQGAAWSLLQLQNAASDLLRLGAVEVIVADPEPQLLLRVTPGQQDAVAILRTAIARLLEEATALPLPPIPGTENANTKPRDGRSGLEKLRAAAVEEVTALVSGGQPASRARDRVEALTREEITFVRQRLDTLALLLLDRQAQGDLGSRRALLWVTDGYDTDPGRFYSTLLPPAPQSVEDSLAEAASARSATGGATTGEASVLEGATEDLSRLLASYGWLPEILAAPPAPSPIQPGIRIGKLRLYLPGINGPQPFIPSALVGGTWEANREPKKAAAYVDLGRSYREAHQLDKAEEALRLAIYHFDGDPRTADQQAEAWRLLGEVLEEGGDPVAGRLAQAVAVQLDPSLAEEIPAWNGGPLAGRRPLERLAAAAAGRVVGAENSLDSALLSLRRRWRLTYQIPGITVGSLLPVEIRLADQGKPAGDAPVGGEPAPKKLTPVAPRWARFGTPAVVPELRLRRFLATPYDPDQGLPRGGLPLLASALVEDDETYLRLRLGPMGFGSDLVVPRVSWVTGEEDGTLEFHHRSLEPFPPARLAGWQHSEILETSGEIAVVLLEDLMSGRWGMALVEVP